MHGPPRRSREEERKGDESRGQERNDGPMN